MLNSPLGTLGTRSGVMTGVNLLARNLGDAGGLKTYQGGDGVVYDNDLGGGSYAYRTAAHYWDGSSWKYGGFLTETSQENLSFPSTPPASNSGNYSSIDNGTANAATDPKGGNTATWIEETTDGQRFFTYTQTAAISPGDPKTGALWLKLTGSNEGDGSLDLTLARAGAGTFESTVETVTLTSSWLRFEVTHTFANAQTGVLFYPARRAGGAEEFYVWGVQMQDKPYCSSVIETTTAAASMVADTAAVTGNALVGPVGSLVATIRPYEGASGFIQVIYQTAAPNNADRLILRVGGAGTVSLVHRQSGADVTLSFGAVTVADQTLHRIAASWGGSEIRLSVDGQTAVSAAVAGEFAQALTNNYYGHSGSGSSPLNGFLPGLLGYNYQMSAAELESRSAV